MTFLLWRWPVNLRANRTASKSHSCTSYSHIKFRTYVVDIPNKDWLTSGPWLTMAYRESREIFTLVTSPRPSSVIELAQLNQKWIDYPQRYSRLYHLLRPLPYHDPLFEFLYDRGCTCSLGRCAALDILLSFVKWHRDRRTRHSDSDEARAVRCGRDICYPNWDIIPRVNLFPLVVLRGKSESDREKYEDTKAASPRK